jgi:cytochrome c oxidase assembly protein subunit 15
MPDPNGPHSPVLHALAVAAAWAAMALLLIGGLVTTKDAGMAVPDWPTTEGYHLFAYPWAKWTGGIFYEHSHRVAGAVVGILMLALCAAALLVRARRAVRVTVLATTLAVCVQGLLGGLRVIENARALAVVHAALAYPIFAAIVAVASLTSRECAAPAEPREHPAAAGYRRLLVAFAAAVWVQILFGAVLRHFGARLDAHLTFAAVVTLLVGAVEMKTVRHFRGDRRFSFPGRLAGVLVALQWGLGFGSFLAVRAPRPEGRPGVGEVVLTTLHVLAGALLLATAVLLNLRARRLLRVPGVAAARAVSAGDSA